MQAVSPVIAPEFQSFEKIYAKNSPTYLPLPVIEREDGILLSRWQLSPEERLLIAQGADIMFYTWTFKQPLLPIRIEVAGADRTMLDTAEFMGLLGESVER